MTAPAGVAIRTADQRDAGACVRILVRSWKGGYRGIVPDRLLDELDEETAAGWMPAPGGGTGDASMTTAVAEVAAGVVCGFVRYGADPDDPSPASGYVAALYVEPGSAGQGIGRRLLS